MKGILEQIFETEIDKPKYPPSKSKKSPSIKPSSLGTPCMRKLYYSYNKVEEDFEFPLSAKRIMKLGDSVHEMLSEVFRNAGVSIHYYDKDGNPITDSQGKVNHEFPISSEELEIKLGYIDEVMILNGQLWLGEYKSINDNGFNKLTGPKPDHFIQGITYFYVFNKMLRDGKFSHIKELQGFEKAEGIIFLYVNKNNSEFKEFERKASDQAFMNIVKKIQDVKDATSSKTLPEKTPDWCNSCSWRLKCGKNFNI